MDGVGTPIIGRPRPLPGHDTPNPAYHPHTLNYEEPVNTRAGFDYVVQDGPRLEVKDQVCLDGQAVWQMWLEWFKTQAEQVGVNVEVVEENWDKEPVVFDADVSASQLATYALILQGRRFTLDPGLEIQDHVYCGVQEQIYY